MRQRSDLDPKELSDEIKALRAEVDRMSEERHKDRLKQIVDSPNIPDGLTQAIKCSSEKGASSWVTASPSFDHGTVLQKGQFVDACCIRYGWTLSDLPLKCACGLNFSLQHALDCQLGGLRTIQHNEVRDVLAQCMREAGHSLVETEPQLQPLTGEGFHYKSANKDDEARSDIKCYGFWSTMRQAYFDIRVISPLARSYAHMNPTQLYNHAEKEKIRQYRERILQVEHADFNPLVFSCTGGMAPQSMIVMKRLSEKMAKKLDISQSVVSGWLRCRLSFALLRTTLLCVRATRYKRRTIENNVELAVSEAHIKY